MFVERPDELALEYTRCLMTALLLRGTPPARALMLGLGGASLVKFLLRQIPDCRVDVVELRPKIVEVARRFFALPEDGDRLRIHVTDGRRYLLDHEPPGYDLILLDLHTSHGMSPVVMEEDFLPACRRCTTDSGILSANLWYGVDAAEERRIRRRIETAYDRVLYLPVAGKRNCVAHGVADGQLPTHEQMQARATQWLQQAGLPLPDLLGQLLRHNATL
jgi:spermidine synthase